MPFKELYATGRRAAERPLEVAFRGMQRKARAVLDGDGCYTDQVLSFVRNSMGNGQSYAGLAGALGLSYEEMVELGVVLRKRVKALRRERAARARKAFCWN
ncbi:MAG: hypothetical protein Kow0025_15850 [Thermodesulfovibrionales bacterium]